ncbi:MAG: DUF3048 domain-containing protein [Lachnospiraceae bacterium]|jgi:hypothetical protein|nr:DUF3048 domain-containing protein [Lachnospiraceae bacterium]
MKKLEVLLITAFASVSILAGCGAKEEEPAPQVVEEPKEEPAEEKEEEPEEVEEEEKEVLPAGKARSALTGEIIDEEIADSRPIAIMLPSDKAAQPQYGIGEAGVLYECMEEGDMSRQMAVIENWKDIETLGNVRSCRDYYVYWALEWDPILVHFGGPYYLADVVNREDVDNITGCAVNSTSNDPGAAAFYRTTDKEAPHNAYTSGSKLTEQCEKLEYSLTHTNEEYHPEHFLYATKEENTLEGQAGVMDAKEIDLTGGFPYTKSSLTYNEEKGIYEKSLYGSPQKDGTTGEQLSFENVVIQFAHYEVRDAKGYLAFNCHDNTHDGYYITNGKAVHVKWAKTSDYSPTRFYYDDLSQVEFNVGKTYIAIVEDDKSFTIDGETYKSDTQE